MKNNILKACLGLFAMCCLFIDGMADSIYTLADETLVAAKDDISLSYLRMIFGSVGTALTGSTNQLAGEIFKVFNFGVLVVTGSLVSYTMVMTVVNTSQDAQQAANKVSPWVTLRIVTGASMLVPQFNGYSGVQVLVMTAVVKGVGFADVIWSQALNFIKDTGQGVYSAPSTNAYNDLGSIATDDNSPVYNMYNSTLCLGVMQQYIEKLKGDSTECGRITLQNNDFGMSSTANGNSRTYKFGIKNTSKAELVKNSCFRDQQISSLVDACGVYTFNLNEMGDKDAGIKNQTLDAAVKQIEINLMPFREWFRLYVKEQSSTGGVMSQKMCGGFQEGQNPLSCGLANNFNAFAASYISLINRLRSVPDSAKIATDWIDDAKAQGWIMAGMHYRSLTGGGDGKAQKQQSLSPAITSFMLSSKSFDPSLSFVRNLNHKTSFINEYFAKSDNNKWVGIKELIEKIIENKRNADNPLGDTSTGSFEKGTYAYTVNHLVWKSADILSKMRGGLKAPVSGSLASNLDFASKNLVTSLMIVMQNVFGFFQSGSTTVKYKDGIPLKCKTKGGFKDTKNYISEFSQCIIDGRGILGSMVLKSKGGHSDPLYQTANLGGQMINAAALYWVNTLKQLYGATVQLVLTTFGIVAGIEIVGGIAQAFFPNPAGAGAINAIAGTAQALVKMLFELDKAAMELFLPLGSALMTAVFSAGVVLAVYVPFMPFLLFLFGAIGWIISVIEAMVAAPLVAMGVTHPEGHDLLGKSEQALMLLLGVFIRPALMIIGLFFAITLAHAALDFMNMGFIYALVQFYNSLEASISDVGGESVSGFVYIISSVGIMTVYTYIIVAVLEQVFSLIYKVPSTILEWIGGPRQEIAGAQQLQGAKRETSSKAGQAGGAAGQTSGQAPQMSPGQASNFSPQGTGKGSEGKGQSTVGGKGGGGGGGGGKGSGGKKATI